MSQKIKGQQLYRILLQRNAYNQSVLRKFQKKMEARDQQAKPISIIDRQPQHTVYFPPIFNPKPKASIVESTDTSKGNLKVRYIDQNQSAPKLLMRHSLDIIVPEKKVFAKVTTNKTENMITCNRAGDQVGSNSEYFARKQLKLLKSKAVRKDYTEDRKQISSLSVMIKKPINLKSISIHTESDQASQGPHKKTIKKTPIKNFILSSTGCLQPKSGSAKATSQEDGSAVNTIKKDIALVKYINASIDSLIQGSIFRNNSDERDVMIKVNSIPIVRG